MVRPDIHTNTIDEAHISLRPSNLTHRHHDDDGDYNSKVIFKVIVIMGETRERVGKGGIASWGGEGWREGRRL